MCCTYILCGPISRNYRHVIWMSYLLCYINFKLHFNKVGERMINKVQHDTKSVPYLSITRICVILELVYSRFMYIHGATCNPAGVGRGLSRYQNDASLTSKIWRIVFQSAFRWIKDNLT